MPVAPTGTEATRAPLARVEHGFNARDVDALLADMTEDTVWEYGARRLSASSAMKGRRRYGPSGSHRTRMSPGSTRGSRTSSPTTTAGPAKGW